MSKTTFRLAILAVILWLVATAFTLPIGISIAKSWGVSRGFLAGINVAGSFAASMLCIFVGTWSIRAAVLVLITSIPILNFVSGRLYLIADPFVIQPLSATLWILFFLSIPAWKKIILRPYDFLWLYAIIVTFFTSFLVAPDTTEALRATISFGVEPLVAYIVFRCAFSQNRTAPPIGFFVAAVAGMMIVHFGLIGLDLYKIGGIKALFASRVMQRDMSMNWTGGLNEPSQSATIILMLIFPIIGHIAENPVAKKYTWLVAAMILILFASLTRSTIVLFILFIIIFIWRLKRSQTKLPIRSFIPLLVICLSVTIATMPFLLQRLTGTASSTWLESNDQFLGGLTLERNMFRYLLTIFAHFDLFSSHWLWGIGAANLFEYRGHFDSWGLNSDPSQLVGTLITNIDCLVALGIIGFLLYYGRTLLLLINLGRSIKKASAEIKPGMIGIFITLLYPLLIWNWAPGARPAAYTYSTIELMGSNLHAIIGSFLFAFAASYIEYIKSNVFTRTPVE
jgi:hypothetical protein